MYRILGSWIKPREHAKVGLVPWNILPSFVYKRYLWIMRSMSWAYHRRWLRWTEAKDRLCRCFRIGFWFRFFLSKFDWSTIKRSTEKTQLESRHYLSNLNFARAVNRAPKFIWARAGARRRDHAPTDESPEFIDIHFVVHYSQFVLNVCFYVSKGYLCRLQINKN